MLQLQMLLAIEHCKRASPHTPLTGHFSLVGNRQSYPRVTHEGVMATAHGTNPCQELLSLDMEGIRVRVSVSV